MGAKAIRVIAFLDIIMSAGFIAQQVSYTADQYNSYLYPMTNITENTSPKRLAAPSKPKCTPYIFPIGQIVIGKKGTNPPKVYIPKDRLWLILILVVSTSIFSIISSMAVIQTAETKYHPSTEKFTFWMKCYGVSLLAAIIVAVVGHSSFSVLLSCILFIGLRACLAFSLSEEFVCVALKATLRDYKKDAIKKLEGKKKKKASKKEKIIEKQHNSTTFLVTEFPSIKEQSHNLMVQA